MSEQKWIPVTEKLPNLNEYTGKSFWEEQVLITGYLSFDDKKERFVSRTSAKNVVYNNVHDTVILAWMPSPDVYKG